jgi:glutamyl/glutaminyl-tRNA synthetase
VPEYAHLPMIVNAQGKPYSKRDGAAFVGEFKEQGYLPEALFNFLVLLGWAPGDDRELMTREDLVASFSLDRVKSSPARFDLKKLLWMNGEYIARQPAETFKAELSARLAAAGLPPAPLGCTLDELVPPVQIRTKTLSDLPGNCEYFFKEEISYDPAAVEKRLHKPGAKERLLAFADAFAALPDFTVESTEALVRAEADKVGEDGKPVGMGALVHPIRVAVSGRTEGPGLFEMLALLGRDRVVRRLRAAAAL